MQAFSLFGRVMLEGGERVERQLDKLDSAGKRTGSMFERLGAFVMGGVLTAGVTKATRALFGMVESLSSAGDEIAATSQKLGIGTDALQEYRYAADQLGVTQDTLERALGRLNQRMGMAQLGNEKYAAALEFLNIQSEKADDAFLEIIEKLHQLEDSQLQAALAAEIFGTQTARQLMPAIQAGGEELLNLRNRAHDLGIVIGEDAVNASGAFQSALGDVRAVLGGISQEFIQRLLPTLERWMVWLSANLPKAWAVFEFVGEVVAIVFKYIGLIIGDSIKWLRGNVIGPFTEWLVRVWSERGPPIVAAVEALWDGVKAVFGAVFNVLRGLWDTFILAFQGDWAGAWERIKDTFVTYWHAIPDLFVGVWDPLVGIVDGIMQAVIGIIRDVFGDKVANIFEVAWDTVIIIFDVARDTILRILDVLTSAFRADWESAWQGIKDIFAGIWGGLIDIVQGPLKGVSDWVLDWVLEIHTWFAAMKRIVVNAVRETANGITEWFSESKLGKTFSWLGDQIGTVTGWFYDMYDKVVGNSYVPDMVEEIGEAVERLQDRLANPVARYTSDVIDSFADMYDSIGGDWPDGPEGYAGRIADTFTGVIGEFVGGLTEALGPLGILSAVLGKLNVAGTILDAMFERLAPVIESVQEPMRIVGDILGMTLAPILEMLQPIITGLGVVMSYVAELVGGAWNAIASALNALLGWAGVNLKKIDVRGIRDARDRILDPPGPDDPGSIDPRGDRGGRAGGRQVSAITGPTRDLLIDLLSPLANLGTLTGIGERIYDLLDARLAPPGMALAGAGAGVTAGSGGTIINIERGAVQVNSPGGVQDLDDDMLDEIAWRLAEKLEFELRGMGQ